MAGWAADVAGVIGAVVFDVGEVLVDETREYGTWADWLGVVAARQGDLEHAVPYGEQALSGPRKSLPSLLMISRDLTRVLKDRYPTEHTAKTYIDQLTSISRHA